MFHIKFQKIKFYSALLKLLVVFYSPFFIDFLQPDEVFKNYNWPAGLKRVITEKPVQPKKNSEILKERLKEGKRIIIPALTTYEVLLAQMAKDFVDVESARNNKLYKSELPGSTIRLNKYILPDSSLLVTANCAKIHHENPPITAANSAIYLTESLLPPSKLTIVDILFHSKKSTLFRSCKF